jgi:predicted lipoprotein with Yx(FWY)xxD motif
MVAALAGTGADAASSSRPDGLREDYVRVPMPPGFQVVQTELEGPVFADANGHTLYRWPRKELRNGDAGDLKGKPSCDDRKYTDNAGLMSPYPGGLTLPDAATRPSCADLWPSVLASKDDKEIGKWTVVERPDGLKQWAYDGFPLYRSTLDREPGDVLGGTKRPTDFDGPAVREPVGPPPNVPPGFAVAQVTTGRMLVTGDTKFAVYASDRDSAGRSKCTGACEQSWKPMLAPETAMPQGEWGIIERSPGVKQWTFRKKPLYTHIDDTHPRSLEGSDEPGWHNVYTQTAPRPPAPFTTHETSSGIVLADAGGHTIYLYNCGDDALDQLACDNPDSPQEYRLAICGGGSADVCLKTFPYVLAAQDAKSGNRTWTTVDIDPATGRRAHGQRGALHVWAYRGRPVFTFAGDVEPGDMMADGYGEFRGARNGFRAFWLRDDFFDGPG